MTLKKRVATVWTRLHSTLIISGHKVKSGRFPLYRLVIFGFLFGSVFQMLFGPPTSLADQLDLWLNNVYIAGQLIGSICVLIAIQFMHDTPTAARIERFGLLWLVSAVAIYFGSVCLTNNGPPVSAATYVLLFIGVYFGYRIYETTKNLRALSQLIDHRGEDTSCE